MNLITLIIHGISSISVYIDVVSVRLLLFFGTLILLSFLGIIGVIALRLYTDLAIPGWASTIGIGLILIILQAFFVLLILSFIILSYRSQMVFIPAIHYRDYILKIEKHE
jgi:polyisoprenyl-phosphate glycosyltransferase